MCDFVLHNTTCLLNGLIGFETKAGRSGPKTQKNRPKSPIGPNRFGPKWEEFGPGHKPAQMLSVRFGFGFGLGPEPKARLGPKYKILPRVINLLVHIILGPKKSRKARNSLGLKKSPKLFGPEESPNRAGLNRVHI